MNLLWTGFLLGLGGSIHCLAMCGPLVMSISGKGRGLSSFGRKLAYNLGRIGAYLIIGLLFGMISQTLSLVLYQQTLAIMTGSLLIALVIFNLVPKRLRSSMPLAGSITKMVLKGNSLLHKRGGILAVTGLGMLNGFLPCGLVYFAATASIAFGSVGQSVVYMFSFGLGTLPLMLLLTFTAHLFSPAWRLRLRQVPLYLTLIIGMLLVVRGSGFGIPYLSPKIVKTEKKVVCSCCEHKQQEIK
jgi:hypothetical protein